MNFVREIFGRLLWLRLMIVALLPVNFYSPHAGPFTRIGGRGLLKVTARGLLSKINAEPANQVMLGSAKAEAKFPVN
jgi:hypothetical protein